MIEFAFAAIFIFLLWRNHTQAKKKAAEDLADHLANEERLRAARKPKE